MTILRHIEEIILWMVMYIIVADGFTKYIKTAEVANFIIGS